MRKDFQKWLIKFQGYERFSNDEKVTNKRIIKNAWAICFLGLFLLIGKYINILTDVSETTIIIFTVASIVIYFILFALTFWTKSFASTPYAKYFYFFSFNLILWLLSYCSGADIKLAYVIVPLISCLYLKSNVVIICNVMTYFTLILAVLTSYIRGHAYISGSIGSFLYNIILITLVFIVFFLIQKVLIKKVNILVNENNEKKKDIKKLQHGLISAFANLLEIKDTTTLHHTMRVSEYTRLICEELAKLEKYKNYLDQETIDTISDAATLHDIGKITVPDSILIKTTPLTSDEFAIIKNHPTAGIDVIENYLKPYEEQDYISVAEDLTRSHHEWWNGNGYPQGLKEKDIPLSARIVSVADVLDSLLSIRPYKQSYDIDKTYEIISSLSGTQFDPDIVSILPNIKNKVKEISITMAGENFA